MKFSSIFKLSMHNLLNNKLRTTLTVIVLLTMSTVIMIMAAFGISFYSSMNKNFQKEFEESGTNFSIVKQEIVNSRNGMTNHSIEFSQEEVNKYLQLLDSDTSLFTTVKLHGESRDVIMENPNGLDVFIGAVPLYTKSNSNFGKQNYLEEGRMWNASDNGTNNIWMHANFLKQGIKVGDVVKFNFDKTQGYIVQGFIKGEKNDYYGEFKPSSILIDYNKFTGKAPTYDEMYGDGNPSDGNGNAERLPNLYIKSIEANLITQGDYAYGISAQNQLKKLEKEISTKNKGLGAINLVTECDILENLKMANWILLAIVAVLLFFAVIIVLLSIGSVSNTIKITVEQNRKFFGMMKAIGMQDKAVRNVVQWQVLFMVLFAVVVSSAIVYGLIALMKGLISSIITPLFGTTAIVVATLNPIIPIVTAALLIASVLLSTLKSLNKISKMDVISVISEVN